MKDILLIGIAVAAGYYIGKDAGRQSLVDDIQNKVDEAKEKIEDRLNRFVDDFLPNLKVEERISAVKELVH